MTATNCPKCGTFMTTIESPFEYETNILIRYCKKCTYKERIHKYYNVSEKNMPTKKPISDWDKLMQLNNEEQSETHKKTVEFNHNLKMAFHYMQKIKMAKSFEEQSALLLSRKIMHDMLLMIDTMYKNKVYIKIDSLTALDLMRIHMELYEIFNECTILDNQTPGQILKRRIEKPDGE